MTADLSSLLAASLPPVLDAARNAGEVILEVYEGDFSVSLKDDQSPLTLADMRSHEVIGRALSDLNKTLGVSFPVLSEEGKSIPYEVRARWDFLWLVDPLDGTKEFIRRNGEFTVNIALVLKGEPILGVVLAPARGSLYFAARGLGAYRIDPSLLSRGGQVAEGLDASKALEGLLALSSSLSGAKAGGQGGLQVVGSRSHLSKETEDYMNRLRQEYGSISFVSAGSALKFCLLAEGMADIYPRFAPTMEWDTAAGQTIVEESGGRVLQAGTGEPLRYNKADLVNPFFVATVAGISH